MKLDGLLLGVGLGRDHTDFGHRNLNAPEFILPRGKNRQPTQTPQNRRSHTVWRIKPSRDRQKPAASTEPTDPLPGAPEREPHHAPVTFHTRDHTHQVSRGTKPSGAPQLSPRSTHAAPHCATSRWRGYRSPGRRASTTEPKIGVGGTGAISTTSPSRRKGNMLRPLTVMRTR